MTEVETKDNQIVDDRPNMEPIDRTTLQYLKESNVSLRNSNLLKLGIVPWRGNCRWNADSRCNIKVPCPTCTRFFPTKKIVTLLEKNGLIPKEIMREGE